MTRQEQYALLNKLMEQGMTEDEAVDEVLRVANEPANESPVVAWIDGVSYVAKPSRLVKRIATVVVMAASLNAHSQGMQASRGPHGGIAAGNALQASRSHAAAAQSGNGGRNSPSVVDDYQPWPESEMRQYQKPHWVPYEGEK